MRTARLRAEIALTAAVLLALVGCAAQPSATSPEPTASVESESPEPAAPTDEPLDEEPAPAPVPGGAYVDYEDSSIESTAGAKVLFFYASWCPQCRALDEELQSEGAPDGLTVFKVDYDDRVDLRQKYGVTLQTTVVYVGDDGEALASAVLYDEPSIDSLLAAAP